MKTMIALLIAGLAGSVGCSNQELKPEAASVANADLKQMVQSKLATDEQFAQIIVDPDASQHQVTLSGPVPSEKARKDAIELAKSARPGLTVVDNIEVKATAASNEYPSDDAAQNTRRKAKELGDKVGRSVSDAWIYTKVEAKLVGHTAAPAFKINVDVENDVVTLRGEVPSESAKREAERIARNTEGVKAVRNLLQVKA